MPNSTHLSSIHCVRRTRWNGFFAGSCIFLNQKERKELTWHLLILNPSMLKPVLLLLAHVRLSLHRVTIWRISPVQVKVLRRSLPSPRFFLLVGVPRGVKANTNEPRPRPHCTFLGVEKVPMRSECIRFKFIPCWFTCHKFHQNPTIASKDMITFRSIGEWAGRVQLWCFR